MATRSHLRRRGSRRLLLCTTVTAPATAVLVLTVPGLRHGPVAALPCAVAAGCWLAVVAHARRLRRTAASTVTTSQPERAVSRNPAWARKTPPG